MSSVHQVEDFKAAVWELNSHIGRTTKEQGDKTCILGYPDGPFIRLDVNALLGTFVSNNITAFFFIIFYLVN